MLLCVVCHSKFYSRFFLQFLFVLYVSLCLDYALTLNGFKGLCTVILISYY
jgi:hypothetical protein